MMLVIKDYNKLKIVVNKYNINVSRNKNYEDNKCNNEQF